MITVLVTYKSGHQFKIRCRSFEVTRYSNGGFTTKWDGAKPKPLLFNPDEIESIYEVDR